MIILPAIDIKNSKCVRLRQGVKEDETIYSDSPLSIARHFSDLGAEFIHIIDLDGAFDGVPVNIDLIRAISSETDTPIEVGGGIRDFETIEAYLDAGVSRVIIGTKAVEDPDFIKDAIKKYGDKIAVSLDCKDDIVYTKGWTESTNHNLFELAESLEAMGLSTLIYTDISRDGMLCGADTKTLERLNDYNFDVIASGGISSTEDLVELSKNGFYGAITGKAVYEGKLDLASILNGGLNAR